MAGTWSLAVVTPRGPGNPYFDLKQQGNKLTGNYIGIFGESSVGGSVQGKNFTIKFSLGGITNVYKGTVEGDKMSGNVDIGDGTGVLQGTFTGKKTDFK
jgi:hypothetical protein